MGMTIVEKILAEKAGREKVSPDEVVRAKIDRAMANDITAPLTVDALEEIGTEKVWDPEKIIIILDHQAPPTTIEAAQDHAMLREFAEQQKISNFYGSFEGVCHQIMVEKAHALPGQLIVGADSHTCTYGALGAFSTGIGSTDMAAVFAEGELWFKVPQTVKIEIEGELKERTMPKDLTLTVVGDVGADGAIYRSLEFLGSGVEKIGISGRMTICNMGVEMGAKAAIVPADDETEKYLESKTDEEYSTVAPDEDADYLEESHYDAGEIVPVAACPHSVDNVHPVRELENTEVQQAFLGSCTNGRFEDLAVAADILEGEEIPKGVRMLVAPASKWIYREALEAGLIDKLVDAGATIEPPGCATCWGGHLGIMAPGEVCVSSSNRNFKGRMGSPQAEIYLSSPATVAASALYGEITDPRDV
ncbi:3-isopropylmalate dehydratase [candidate division MSBL1 archaeon SCGC-AAA259J03]|uniref:3-isopropylmalate dehydratase large subunit n=1 Tax=candidate division MSBL1 archaeon SCGC-AAA259J03 TaxID=1698269 RepID=A0A656YY78_9EURY|nr:3-isopropylmalate dehydratase [candidate division MSBL1 archaeon SCGC-AAA259J03]